MAGRVNIDFAALGLVANNPGTREYARKIAREIVIEAKVTAPKRSGRLAQSVYLSGTGTIAEYRVGATAPYAAAVHEGTTGPIRPTRGRALRLPAFRGFPARFASSVSGQAANPFLRNAMNTVATRHGFRIGRI